MEKTQTSPASPITNRLRELHRELSTIHDGEVATYIPELAKANPDWFAICVVTTNGGVYEVGDSRQPFTIQSISKPFVYGLALEDQGRESVMAKVGVAPTGDAFNSISLDPGTGRPRNPMINAGAIAATGLIEAKTPAIRIRRIMEMFAKYTGHPMELDEAVYRSESETGHRNRAIGYMLRNFEILGGDPTPVVENYFQQCSILGNCLDLATMAATLANRGVNPLTGQQAIRGEYVESVLGVMGTCGMYDYAGEWFYEVGMPAKSGVAGGIAAVLPGQLGIGVYSPRLDKYGNSVRGIRACSALSRIWDLHLLNRAGVGAGIIRHRYTAADFGSSRVRATRDRAALAEHGHGIVVYQLQGNLFFANTEVVIRDICSDPKPIESIILDFRHVHYINESAATLLHDLLLQLHSAGTEVLFTGLPTSSHLRRVIRAKLGARADELFRVYDECDTALQACEDRLLDRVLPQLPEMSIGVDNYELFVGLSQDEVTTLRKFLQRAEFKAGETIFTAGDTARDIYFLARGRVTAFAPAGDGGKRLAVFTAGMVFGEMGVLEGRNRALTMVAEVNTACDLLSASKLIALGVAFPKLKIRLLENLALGLCTKLRKATQEIMQLG